MAVRVRECGLGSIKDSGIDVTVGILGKKIIRWFWRTSLKIGYNCFRLQSAVLRIILNVVDLKDAWHGLIRSFSVWGSHCRLERFRTSSELCIPVVACLIWFRLKQLHHQASFGSCHHRPMTLPAAASPVISLDSSQVVYYYSRSKSGTSAW